MITSKHFNLGTVAVTNGINQAMQESYVFHLEVLYSLDRFSRKDWGELSEEDIQVNEEALNYPDDLYLLGVYTTSMGDIDIITNRKSEKAGDNCTTICFPGER